MPGRRMEARRGATRDATGRRLHVAEFTIPGNRLWPGRREGRSAHVKTRIRGFSLIELMIVVAVVGILAAVAIPNFMKLQGRTRQAEARTNLRALWLSQKVYYQEHDTFEARLGVVGFQPERGNRYAYYVGATTSTCQSRATSNLTMQGGFNCVQVDTFYLPGEPAEPTDAERATPAPLVRGPKGSFEATAVGNIDNDFDVDSWMIFSKTRVAACSGISGSLPAGEACNTRNDLE